MTACDLCGKPATAKATIEGAQMSVCASCTKFGSNVRALPQAPQKIKKTQQQSSSSFGTPKDELVETVRSDVGKLLREYREKQKLNQEQLAAKLQIRASTYNHYESGASVPDVATARKLEHLLKVPLVVHVKTSSVAQKQEESRGMTMGDFLKKK